MRDPLPSVAIVDYQLGNLFSVRNACERVGLTAAITSDKAQILAADAVILPGVGAFGNAMDTLRRLDLASVLKDFAQSEKPLIGICLGVQLLMTESHEFGNHKGLGIVSGPVERLSVELKVPHIGWNRVRRSQSGKDPWNGSPLEGLADDEYMYFVHSYVVRPQDKNVVIATTRYGDDEFCSALKVGNVFACQFHPERSGRHGLSVYRNIARRIKKSEGAAA
jgi:glutamine amidotransferase